MTYLIEISLDLPSGNFGNLQKSSEICQNVFVGTVNCLYKPKREFI